MADATSIRLVFVGPESPGLAEIDADPGIFAQNDIVTFSRHPQSYRVQERTITLDEQGAGQLTLTLRATEPPGALAAIADRLEKFVRGREHNFYLVAVACCLVLMLVASSLVGVLFFVTHRVAEFRQLPPDVQWAYAGLAARWSWLAILIISSVFFGVLLRWLMRLEFGWLSGGAFATGIVAPAVLIGGVTLLWSLLLGPLTWPAGYAALGKGVWHGASPLLTFGAAYAPALLVSLKLLKFDALGEILGSVLPRRGKE